MFKSLSSVLLSLFVVCLPLQAGPHVHVHGSASGSIVVGNDRIEIELRVPALSVVGFERAPSTQEETRLVQEAKVKLGQPVLFRFYEDGGWFKWNSDVEAELLESSVELHLDDHGHDHEEHAEFLIKKSYKVVFQTELEEIETSLFSRLLDLHDMCVDVITEASKAQYEFSNHKTKVTL